MKVKNFHITWNNNLRFKDEIDPFYHSESGFREVVSMGKTVEWEYTLEDGTTIKGREGKRIDEVWLVWTEYDSMEFHW